MEDFIQVKESHHLSLKELRNLARELDSLINEYMFSEKISILRTIRTKTSALGHEGKNFRAVSLAYEKAVKGQQ